jgi:hypothetical protein
MLVEMSKLVDYCNKYGEDVYIDVLDHLLEAEFPNSPFVISFSVDDLKKLDEPFTNLDRICIVDDRISQYNYYYSDVCPSVLNTLSSNLIIKSVDNKPITLRQIINEMILDEHYNSDVVRGDDHCFLESLDVREDSDDIFYTFFGS